MTCCGSGEVFDPLVKTSGLWPQTSAKRRAVGVLGLSALATNSIFERANHGITEETDIEQFPTLGSNCSRYSSVDSE